MPQTLLALCGIVVATFLTLQSQRHRALSAEDILEMETTQMGARVAMDVLSGFRTLPYDENTADAPVASSAALSHHLVLATQAENRFGQRAARRAASHALLTPSATIVTLDHADGRAFDVTRETSEGALTFRVESVVGYVDETTQTPTATPSRLKMATVRVTPQTASGTDPIVLSQLYACGSGCPW